MDVSIPKLVFPKYTAAGAQMGAHGVDAWHSVTAAKNAHDMPTRLDAALSATNAFDHAVSSSRDIPVGRFVPGVGKYYAGYQAAKAAVGIILATGVVPGGREHVGRQEVLDGQAEFHRALDASADTSRYGRYRTGDWMQNAGEDTYNGVTLLGRQDLAQPLMSQLASAAALLQNRRTVPTAAVASLDALYKSVTGAFDQSIAAATPANPGVTAPADLGLAQLPVETAG